MLERIAARPGCDECRCDDRHARRAGATLGTRFTIVGQPPPNPSERRGSAFQMVTPGYFEALGIRVIKGRSIDDHDTADEHARGDGQRILRRALSCKVSDPLGQQDLD